MRRQAHPAQATLLVVQAIRDEPVPVIFEDGTARVDDAIRSGIGAAAITARRLIFGA
ncbi:hypothetical protein [Candidatus Chloroploca sp. Khr17]|uniref:hypothetical protein n=1 Tax=Candidatus Chloroploca sp. Khr17 TaxID=2496869 RepID=UPI0013EA13D0|nr:hypothetical protein [Candidatus Chloroploca sp. Khr17]